MPDDASPPIVPNAAVTTRHGERPEHFSTYVPRELVRRMKVISALYDVPLWRLVTEALERYLVSFESEHGPLPRLAGSSAPHPGTEG